MGIGDIVSFPTKRGNTPLLVTQIKVPEEKINPEYLPSLTEIIEFYPDEADSPSRDEIDSIF